MSCSKVRIAYLFFPVLLNPLSHTVESKAVVVPKKAS